MELHKGHFVEDGNPVFWKSLTPFGNVSQAGASCLKDCSPIQYKHNSALGIDSSN